MIRLTDEEIVKVVLGFYPAWTNWDRDSMPYRLVRAQCEKFIESLEAIGDMGDEIEQLRNELK